MLVNANPLVGERDYPAQHFANANALGNDRDCLAWMLAKADALLNERQYLAQHVRPTRAVADILVPGTDLDSVPPACNSQVITTNGLKLVHVIGNQHTWKEVLR